jgi:hypothetical protein
VAFHVEGDPRKLPVQAFGLFRSWKIERRSRSSWTGTAVSGVNVMIGRTWTRAGK